MDGRDLFGAIADIDENYISDSENSEKITAIFKKSKRKHIKLAASVFCVLAVLAGVSGVYSQKYGNISTSPVSTDSNRNNMALIIARAAESEMEEVKTVSGKELSDKTQISLPYKSWFMFKSTEGMTAPEAAHVINELTAFMERLSETENLTMMGLGSVTKREKICYTSYSQDYFMLDIKDPELLDRIVITRTGKAAPAYLQFTDRSEEPDSDNNVGVNFSISSDAVKQGNENEWVIPGETYRSSQIGIQWNPTNELLEKLENDPDAPLSEIKDRMTFTSFYTDGTSESFTVDIGFTDNGKMIAVIPAE